jgi:hypothetical protein
VFGGQFIRELTGAIRGIIVHDQEVNRNGEFQQALSEGGKVFPLVVSRHYDQSLIHPIETADI